MTGILLLEQALNGLQFGLMLFLLASGLTLVFGIMDMINLAHGALYMVGAFFAAWFVSLTGSFLAGVLLAWPAVQVVLGHEGPVLPGPAARRRFSPRRLRRGLRRRPEEAARGRAHKCRTHGNDGVEVIYICAAGARCC